MFIRCGRLSWLPVSFLLHVKYTLSYRIVLCRPLGGCINAHYTRLSVCPISSVNSKTGKNLGYRKQIARQLCTQCVKGMYSNSVTLKSGLEVTQGLWKWYCLKAWVRFPIRVPYSNWRCLVSFARYSKLLVKNCEIFIPHVYLAPPQGVTPNEFREDVWYSWLGYRVVTKLWRYVKPFR